MKKGMLLGFGVLMIGVFILVGCGQQNPTINTSNNQPQGLKLKGVVRTTTLNSTSGAPISGASVTLSGDTLNHTVLTNSNGEYLIENVPDGSYNLIVTAEGHTRNSLTAVGVAIKPSSAIPADGTITVTDILLLSNPIILSYSPVPTSLITANQTFVVTFDEQMDTTSVLPTLTAAGIRTMVTDSGNVAITAVWDTAKKQLTIAPRSALISNESYTLTINTGAAGARDAAGYPLSTALEQANAATATYRVGTGSGLPGDPTNLAIVYNTTTECDYSRVYNNAGTLFLSWTSPTTGGPVTGYNVYVAYGAAGNFSLVNAAILTANQYTLTSTLILNALYGTGATRDPVCSGGYPFINDSLRIKVVALNGDGESVTGATISARDTLGPTLNAQNDSTMATSTRLDDNVLLPALTSGQAYVSFTEPITSVGAAALYHIGTYEATAATLVSNTAVAEATIGHLAGARSVVKVTVPGPITGGWVASVEAGAATDLSGNASPAQAGFGIN